MFIRFCIFMMLALPAHAYNLTRDFTDGFYWASLPINITVVDSNPSRKKILENLARESVGAWETETGLKLWNLSEGGTNNIIRWSDNFEAETRMNASTVLAVAIRYTNGPYFAKTEIVINGQHNMLVYSNGNPNIFNLKTTLVHELGHTMGLDHSNEWNAIMFPSLQQNGARLDTDDIIGMKDVFKQTEYRQLTSYVSPLSYEQQSSQALSCGTTGPLTQASAGNGMISLAAGMLIGFVRKIFKWFKSFF